MDAASPATPAHRTRRGLAGAAVALLIGGAEALAVVAPANAVPMTYLVTSTDDSGAGTLRGAIALAEANAGFADTIVFDASLAGSTIALDELLFITESLTITGPGSELLTLERADDGVPDFDFFAFAPGVADQDFSVSGLTIRGDSTRGGSGIAVTNFEQPARDIEVADVVFEDLVSGSGGPGMVVTAAATVSIENSAFNDNETDVAGGAVRLHQVGGFFEVIDSRFTGNSALGAGGAIAITDPSGGLGVSGSVFTDNSSGVDGGGAIWTNWLGNTSGIVASVFESNLTVGRGGAVHVGSTSEPALFVQDTSFIANIAQATGQSDIAGGALFVGTVLGGLLVDSSTFSNNEIDEAEVPRYGRSIGLGSIEGPVLIVNSTLDELTATTDDPVAEFAIYVQENVRDGQLDLQHSTITGPGALRIESNSATVDLTHTLFDALGEAPAIELVDLPSTPVNLEWSLLTTAHVGTFVADLGNNGFSVADFELEALADNGGPTATRFPAVGSPAREGGDPAIAVTPEFDQRGDGFERVLETIDIGAVETEPTLPATGVAMSAVVPIGGALLLLVGIGAVAFVRLKRAN